MWGCDALSTGSTSSRTAWCSTRTKASSSFLYIASAWRLGRGGRNCRFLTRRPCKRSSSGNVNI
ncbi:hypothetical protein LOD64_10485, partial [Xylella fastidiosa subsp. multiplex]|uniref:hypothetical protein n=1 Tax=Xylella fastidiosa TaxID=2371 RepID=UPI002362ACCE